MVSLPGLYLSNFIRGGSKFWLLKSTTMLMHRYIEHIEIWRICVGVDGGGLKSTPLAFLIAAGGSEILAGVQPPIKYSPDHYTCLTASFPGHLG